MPALSATTPAPATREDSLTANLNTLIEAVKAGKSDTLRAYLAAMGQFTAYSFGNMLEIFSQRPNATRVAGYGTWKKLGRQVRKGAKGIRIYAPIVTKSRVADDPACYALTTSGQKFVCGFKAVHVFDQADTDGDDLPALTSSATGIASEHLARLIAYTRSLGIAVAFDASIAPALGMSYGGKISLLPGMSDAETTSTLAHEVAHEILHKGERRHLTNKKVRETEAEAVAYVVCCQFGITSLTASTDYVQLYNGDAATLAESFRFIHQTAKEIVEGLEAYSTPLNEGRTEKTVQSLPAYKLPLAA